MAGLLLELERDVLGDVAEPGALVEPLDETTPATPGAGVVVQPGHRLHPRGGVLEQ